MDPRIKPCADLRGADLRRADLRGADLRGANLYGADLRHADLRVANLGSADLGSADLRGANLGSADLRGANLRDADLHGVNLRHADLRGAKRATTTLSQRAVTGQCGGYWWWACRADCDGGVWLEYGCERHPIAWWQAQDLPDLSTRHDHERAHAQWVEAVVRMAACLMEPG